jgi:WD40 repeat protein
VKADPVPRPPVKVANAGKPIALTGDFPQVLIAPSRPSPFLSSGLNDFPQHKREVWNLETAERTASFSGFQMTDHGVLSPDGAYVAGKFNQPNLPFVVISCKDGKKVFELDDITLGLFDFLDFSGPRLVIGKKEFDHRAYHLFDIATGRKLREFTTPPVQHEAKANALSGGGKYLALKSGNDVLIFDLDSGKQVGQFAIPSVARGNYSFRELAFSPDGKELALLFDSATSMRIVTWDLVGNRPGVDHRVPPSVVRSLKTPGTVDGPNIYFGRHLEWLGDGSGWLVRGEVVIDKANGAAVWRVPITGDDWRWTRHVVGSSHVAKLGGTFEARTLELLEIRRGEFAAGGPNPDPVKPPNPPVQPPPPPPPADLAGDGTPQPADVDPAPAPKAGLLDLLTLNGKPDEIRRVLFSRPDVAQTAVVTIAAANADRNAPRPASVERYDLTTGKSLGKLDLYDTHLFPPHDAMADLSGDGTLFALTHLQDQKRVEAWDLTEGKRVASWVPYEKQPGGFAYVTAIAVVDAKHVLTVNLPGDLILWSVPECKPVRTWNHFAHHRQMVLSPGRKYVVLRGQKGLALCNPLTGDVRGRLPFPAGLNVLEILAGTFRPDGKELAAVVTVGDGRGPAPRHLVRWDATTGKVIDSHPVAVTPWAMNWCGDSGLLLDWTLLDWKAGVPVCTYSARGAGMAVRGSPDGRFWFTHNLKATEPVRLAAQLLPDETAKQAAAQIAAGQVQLVLKPGTKISVQLDAAGPAGEAMWRQQYEQRLAQDLNNTTGLLVAEGQPITLKLSAKESDTGEKLRATLVTRQGRRNTTRTEVPDVPRKRLTCQATLTDAQGKALMEPKDQVFEFPEMIVAAENRDDPVGTVTREQSKRLWNSFSSWVYVAGVPAFVAREGDKVVPWPRTVELGQAQP